MNRRVLVTGGAGFIGHHLVRQLTGAGHHVSVIDPKATKADFPGSVDVHPHSVLDPAALRRAGEGAEWIFHLAAIAHLWCADKAAFDRINVEATRSVLNFATAHRPEKLVVTSTEAILRGWDDPTTRPLTEDEPTPDISTLAGPYTRSKFRADRLVHEAGTRDLPVVTLYPTVPVGPGDRWRTAPTQMLELFLLSPPPAFLDCVLNLVPVGDVARAHILAAEKGGAGDRYLIGGEDVAMDKLLSWLAPMARSPLPNRRIPFRVAYLAAYVSEMLSHITKNEPAATIEGVRLARHAWRIDSSRAREELGWHAGPAYDAVIAAATERVGNERR